MLEVQGLRIAFERAGSGPPLVLLHGFVGDSREWRHQVDGLSSDYTVVAWDAPGAGRSADPPASYRLPQYADALAGLIAALRLERPHVCGLSFGGALALELYRRHPAIPRSLIIVAGYAGWAGSLPVDVAAARLQRSLELLDEPAERFVTAMLPTLFSAAAAPERVATFAAIMADLHPDGFRVMARSLAEADLRDVLPIIAVPTLLVYSDGDVRAEPGIGEALRAGIPRSRLVVLAGVGHMIDVEAPERLTAEMRGFLATVSS